MSPPRISNFPPEEQEDVLMTDAGMQAIAQDVAERQSPTPAMTPDQRAADRAVIENALEGVGAAGLPALLALDNLIDASFLLENERDRFRKLNAEAATYVESVICMRTDFSGAPPYVGWKGLGLKLNEVLDELVALRAAPADGEVAAAAEWLRYRAEHATNVPEKFKAAADLIVKLDREASSLRARVAELEAERGEARKAAQDIAADLLAQEKTTEVAEDALTAARADLERMREALEPFGLFAGSEVFNATTAETFILIAKDKRIAAIQRHAFVNAIAALASAGPASSPWRAMDSAPRDGTPILIRSPGDRLEVVAWGTGKYNRSTRKYGQDWSNGPNHGYRPTHWMPLPPPPQQPARPEGEK